LYGALDALIFRVSHLSYDIGKKYKNDRTKIVEWLVRLPLDRDVTSSNPERVRTFLTFFLNHDDNFDDKK
jgi:hypothetical protein